MQSRPLATDDLVRDGWLALCQRNDTRGCPTLRGFDFGEGWDAMIPPPHLDLPSRWAASRRSSRSTPQLPSLHQETRTEQATHSIPPFAPRLKNQKRVSPQRVGHPRSL